MADNRFFDESRDQSIIKTEIIESYFLVWANIMMRTQDKAPGDPGRICYLDVFAGPGRYKDGTASTPLRILQKAIQDPRLAKRLMTIFNDGDSANASALTKAIDELSGIEKLTYPPHVLNEDVGEHVVKVFEDVKLIPTFFFIDPWGYLGLSLKLINAVIKDWGCDCVFFFNYNRINMGINNDAVAQHIDSLFGAERARRLRETLQSLDPLQRELTIVEELAQALKSHGSQKRYVLPFTFKNDKGTRTSHHLVFVAKSHANRSPIRIKPISDSHKPITDSHQTDHRFARKPITDSHVTDHESAP